MTMPRTPAPSTSRRGALAKGLAFSVLLALLLAASTLALGEITLRLLGVKPWRRATLDIDVEPGGSLFVKDATLGYRLRPGKYRMRMHTGYSFAMTNTPDGRRVSEPDDQPSALDQRPEIWLFGCSFTYGYSVDDRDSIAWQLQTHMPQYDVLNYGVPGYGTVQAYLQIQEAFQKGLQPRLVVVLYFEDHDRRNTLLRERRKLVSMFNRLGPMSHPYARLGSDGSPRVIVSDQLYHEFPLMRVSALAHATERLYNAWEQKRVASHEVTKALLAQLAAHCRRHGVPFLVAGFTRTAATQDVLSWCGQQKILAADISCDWSNQENSNWPADAVHASPLGYARLAANLQSRLRLGPLRADYETRLADPASSPAAHLDLGTAYLRQYQNALELGISDESLPPAIAEFQQALAQQPDSAETHLQLATALQFAGNDAAAIEHCRRALVAGNNAFVATRLAWLLATTSDANRRQPQEALKLADEACRAATPPDPESLQAKAAALAAAGDFEEAAHAATEALRQATLARRFHLAAEIHGQLDRYRASQPLSSSRRDPLALWPIL